MAGSFAGLATTPVGAATTRIMLTASQKYDFPCAFMGSRECHPWALGVPGRPEGSPRVVANARCHKEGLE